MDTFEEIYKNKQLKLVSTNKSKEKIEKYMKNCLTKPDI